MFQLLFLATLSTKELSFDWFKLHSPLFKNSSQVAKKHCEKCQFSCFYSVLLKFDRQNLSSRMIVILELTGGSLTPWYLTRNVKCYTVI